MSSILLVTLIVSAVFACMFGFCEWVARSRSARSSGSRQGVKDLSERDSGRGETTNLAALWRLWRRCERENGSGPDWRDDLAVR